ncbi:MAG: glycosyltransferase family 2 protein [bacterium]
MEGKTRDENTHGTVLTFVIVHWNTEPELKECIEAILSAGMENTEVVVVDNASDGIETLPWNSYPEWVRLVRNNHNSGYAAASNQGIRAARGENILLLNPDVRVNREGLREMTARLDSPEASAVTARLDRPDGTFQRYYMRFPTLPALLARYTLLEPLFRNTAPVRRYLETDMEPDAPQAVEQAPGACLMMKKSFLEEIGLMDERFPLFFNDVDLCRRIALRKGRILYTPGARFVHLAQASVRKMDTHLRNAEFRVAMIRYMRKYHGACRALILKGILTADLCARLAVNLARFSLGRRTRDEIKTARKGLRLVLANRSIFE